jgi:hypothetical protein
MITNKAIGLHGFDYRFGHQWKTLEPIDPDFPAGKTEAG